MRYHKDVYFSGKHQENIISLTYALNQKGWSYTTHCLDNARLRVLDLSQLLYFIKNELILNSDDVFEFYADDKKNIYRLCYRIKYNKFWDFILVLGIDKTIITIYVNDGKDLHFTLKKELYAGLDKV